MSAAHRHTHIEAVVNVVEITQPNGAPSKYALDVQVRCASCKVRFRFDGVATGVDDHEPRVSPDGFELRAPIVPDAAATLFGTVTPTSRIAEGMKS